MSPPLLHSHSARALKPALAQGCITCAIRFEILIFASMKLLSIIFCTFIIFLQISPLLESSDMCEESECSISYDSSESNSNNEDEDCCGSCNPFISCSTCIGFNLPTTYVVTSETVTYGSLFSQYFPSESICHTWPIWHPPQV